MKKMNSASEKLKIGKARYTNFWGNEDQKWKDLRFRVFTTYGKKCMKCRSIKNIQVDHIKSVSRFPELKYEFDNLQVLCEFCNSKKGNNFITDYRNKPKLCEVKETRNTNDILHDLLIQNNSWLKKL